MVFHVHLKSTQLRIPTPTLLLPRQPSLYGDRVTFSGHYIRFSLPVGLQNVETKRNDVS